MKLICPSCGAVASVEAWLSNVDARQCIRLVAEMPTDIAQRALPYLSLFRPRVPDNEKGYRGLIWPRALRLLVDLKGLIDDAHISWEKRPARPNSVAAWSQAMEQVLQRPPRRLPLESHGYLRRIAYDIADEMDRAAETAANKAIASHSSSSRAIQERSDLNGLEPVMSMETMKAIREKNMGSKK